MEAESQHSGKAARTSFGDRIVASALYLLVATLLITEVSWLAHSVTEYLLHGDTGVLTSGSFSVDADTFAQSPVYLANDYYGPDNASATILIHIAQNNVANQTAQVVVTLDVSQTAWLPVIDTSTGRSILCGSNQDYLCPQYADDAMSLVDGTSQLSVPIGVLYSSPTFSQTMTLPTTGDPSLYPFDTYQLNLHFSLKLPHPLWSTQPWGDHHGLNELPLAVEVDTAVSMQSYSLAFVRSDESPGLNTEVVVKRDTASKWYILSIALIPLMLSILFWHFLLNSRSPEKRLSLEALIALATFVIAILPLRAVLVPPDVAGLTYVDTILGLGLVTTVSVVTFQYARSVWAAPYDVLARTLRSAGAGFRRGKVRRRRQADPTFTTTLVTSHSRIDDDAPQTD